LRGLTGTDSVLHIPVDSLRRTSGLPQGEGLSVVDLPGSEHLSLGAVGLPVRKPRP